MKESLVKFPFDTIETLTGYNPSLSDMFDVLFMSVKCKVSCFMPWEISWHWNTENH